MGGAARLRGVLGGSVAPALATPTAAQRRPERLTGDASLPQRGVPALQRTTSEYGYRIRGEARRVREPRTGTFGGGAALAFAPSGFLSPGRPFWTLEP